MKQNYSIFVSIALVAATMFFCGKNVDFLLYTLLGRSILVLSIIGLTIFNKYVGILATIFVTTLYNISDYKEGFNGETGDESENELGNLQQSLNAPYGAGTSSSPAEIAQEEANDEEEDDDEVKPVNDDDEGELTTIGHGPLDQSNTLI
jgi:hypothetical protein